MQHKVFLAFLAILSIATVPTASARSVSGEYITSNGMVIVYMHNYYAADWDMGGFRFTVYAGETTATFHVTGGDSTALVDFTTAQNQVLSSRIFCGNEVTVPIPPGARFAHVYVGADASFHEALYPGAPQCGVLVPPPTGWITGEFN